MIPAAKPLIGDEERIAVDRVLRSGMIAGGPEVAAFERDFGDQVVAGRDCVAVSSGTAGLLLGLLAAGVGPGDEVIVPSFTFAATANAVALAGATPVFADIERPISASGEGGMVSCADARLARSVRLLRNQGMERGYENEVVGFNARMTDVHAAIGRAQLAKLLGWTQQRQQNAKFLDANLRGVIVPPVADGAIHVYHQYTIRVPDDRDGFARALADEHGVGTGVYYPIPSHRLPSFDRALDLPETERAAREVLSLPVHPALSADALAAIAAAVNAVAAAGPTWNPWERPAGWSMAYQAICAPLNVISAWKARPHFSMTRREAWCPAAVALMIRVRGVCCQPNRIASRAPSVARPRPQYSGASS